MFPFQITLHMKYGLAKYNISIIIYNYSILRFYAFSNRPNFLATRNDNLQKFQLKKITEITFEYIIDDFKAYSFTNTIIPNNYINAIRNSYFVIKSSE